MRASLLSKNQKQPNSVGILFRSTFNPGPLCKGVLLLSLLEAE